jgi:RNA polymerase primary sigma factor
MIELDATAIKQILDTFPDCLTPRSKQIIEMRYGLLDGKPKTLQQIGDIYGVSRERIRQIERKILRKLKHPSRLKQVFPDCDKIDLVNENRGDQ